MFLFLFFQIFELGNILENFDQKSKKIVIFCQNITSFGIFWHFLVKSFKNIA